MGLHGGHRLRPVGSLCHAVVFPKQKVEHLADIGIVVTDQDLGSFVHGWHLGLKVKSEKWKVKIWCPLRGRKLVGGKVDEKAFLL
jgi:hypothetical protein